MFLRELAARRSLRLAIRNLADGCGFRLHHSRLYQAAALNGLERKPSARSSITSLRLRITATLNKALPVSPATQRRSEQTMV